MVAGFFRLERVEKNLGTNWEQESRASLFLNQVNFLGIELKLETWVHAKCHNLIFLASVAANAL
jgi:hypothetical protein